MAHKASVPSTKKVPSPGVAGANSYSGKNAEVVAQGNSDAGKSYGQNPYQK